ncbi:MAG: hypothetical protein KF752_16375 [Pirellulaceae bacterium]|nr:hypothetical protein [Pirellulaceae bacterium]
MSSQLVHWGSDHIGRPTPDYITGDECLFCHRSIGITWPQNPHQTTMRLADSVPAEIQSLAAREPQAAGQVDFVLGADRLVRFLRRSGAYGQLEMLSAGLNPEGHLIHEENVHWDGKRFGQRCIGCHTTAVDSQQQTFAATSLDCFACHGEVVLEHTGDISKVLLSGHPQDPLVVNSICCSCHLRGGKSQTTDLPYPNAFVPGDNLFRDFQVDLSDSAIAALPAMQQHIYVSGRLVGSGAEEPSCIDCHSVHGKQSDRHMELKDSAICSACHVSGSDNSQLVEAVRQYDRRNTRNTICDY